MLGARNIKVIKIDLCTLLPGQGSKQALTLLRAESSTVDLV